MPHPVTELLGRRCRVTGRRKSGRIVLVSVSDKCLWPDILIEVDEPSAHVGKLIHAHPHQLVMIERESDASQ